MSAPGQPTTPPPLSDAAARSRAVRVFDRNLLVTAGAGTGKTSLLVGRLAAALVKRHMEPHQVLALTFTENAAAEMRERLLRVLRAADAFVAGEPLADESDRHTLVELEFGAEELPRAHELLDRAEELQVQTFHGFCLRLLQQHARALGLPPRVTLLDDDERDRRFDDAFLQYLREVDDDPPHPALLRFEPLQLGRLARGLAGAVPPEARAASRMGPDTAPLAEVESGLAALEVEAAGARDDFLRHLARVREACDAVRGGDRERLEALRGVDWSKAPKAGAREFGGGADGKARSEELTERLAELAKRLQPWIGGDDDTIADAIEFLEPFLQRWREQCLRDGAMSFDDLIVHTRHVLRTDEALRAGLAARYLTILVDEFQDTDPLQYDIVFLLGGPTSERSAAAHETAGDPLSTPLRPCLFLVGDAKQSIYRFRRADLAAFGRVRDLVLAQGGEELVLDANFRSVPAVLDFVNHVGERTLVEEPPFQARFGPVVPVRTDDEPRFPVEVWVPAERPAAETLPTPADGGADGGGDHEDSPAAARAASTAPADAARRTPTGERRAREAAWVIRWIRETERAGIPYGRQAVLLRATSDLGWLLRPLRRAGLPYLVQGSRRFYQRHEVQLATALVSAVARPWDPVPVLGVLRSAFVGARDGVVRDYLRMQGKPSLDPWRAPEAVGGEAEVVRRGLAWIRELSERCARLPVGRALDLLLSLPEWPVVDGMGFEGAQSMANLERLHAQLGRARPRDLADAASLLERRVLQEVEDEEGALFDAGETTVDAVHILSVHASKGLEYDAVVVADCARSARGGREIGDGDAGRLFLPGGRIVLGATLDGTQNTAALRINADASSHTAAEELRLLYVAATRARRRLTLLFTEEGTTRGNCWQKSLEDVGVGSTAAAGGGDAPDTRWRVRAVDPRAEDTVDPRGQVEIPAASLPSLRAAAREHQARRAAAAPVPTPPPPRLVTAPGGATTLGSELHEYLRLVDVREPAVQADLLHACARAVGQRRPSTELFRLAEAFHRSSLRRQLLAADRFLREVPVSWLDIEGQPRHGVVDLLVRGQDGDWTVVDHKTDHVDDDADGEGLAQIAADRHGDQLRAYAEGVRTALDLDAVPRTAVWFARADRLVEVEAGA